MAEIIRGEKQKKVDIKSIFRQTFFISQGAAGLQDLLFQWLAQAKIVTLNDFGAEIPEWVTNVFPPNLHDVSGKKMEGVNNTAASREWQQFKRMYLLHNEKNDKNLLAKILSNTLIQDLSFQVRGRPNREGTRVHPDDRQDLYKSFTRYYILNNNFHTQPFRTLFSELNVIISKINKPSEEELSKIEIPISLSNNQDARRMTVGDWATKLTDSQRLGILSKLWEQNHPGEKFF